MNPSGDDRRAQVRHRCFKELLRVAARRGPTLLWSGSGPYLACRTPSARPRPGVVAGSGRLTRAQEPPAPECPRRNCKLSFQVRLAGQ